MTAATQDIKSDKLGTEEVPDPPLLPLLVEANVLIYGGTMVGTDAAGYAVPASDARCVMVWGRAERQVNNLNSNAPFGAQGAQVVSVRKGPFYQNQDASISQANVGQSCFAVDDNTVSLSDAGGTRPYAGVILPGQKASSSALTSTSQVAVWLGLPNAYQSSGDGQLAMYRARSVVTANVASLAAFVGVTGGSSTNSDGVLAVQGDIVLLTAQTTPAQNGPYIVGAVAAGTAALTRPTWWKTGSVQPSGTMVSVGGEGTHFKNSTWKAMSANRTFVVDTTDPQFYPQFDFATTVAMTAGAAPANSTMYVFTGLAGPTNIDPVPVTPGGTQGTLRVSTQTPGLPGTSSVVITSSSGTDTSTVKIQVQNW